MPTPTLTQYQDAVSQVLWGVNITYSALNASVKSRVDDLGTEALVAFQEMAKWYAQIDPATEDFPSAFNELLKEMWVERLKREFRSPQDAHAHRTTVIVPLQRAVADHYTKNWDSANVLANDTISLQTMRESVVARLVRQRTPVFPPIQDVDRRIREEFVKLWDRRKWEFRRRSAKFTIKATTGDLESDGSFTIDGMACRSFIIKNSSNHRREVHFAASIDIPEIAANYDGKTGMPQFFADFDRGSSQSIQWFPMPDQDYSAWGSIWEGAPSFGTEASSSDGLDRLPPTFRGWLRDRVTACILHEYGREDVDAARAMSLSEGEFDKLAAEWDDKGASRSGIDPGLHRKWNYGRGSYTPGNAVGDIN